MNKIDWITLTLDYISIREFHAIDTPKLDPKSVSQQPVLYIASYIQIYLYYFMHLLQSRNESVCLNKIVPWEYFL